MTLGPETDNSSCRRFLWSSVTTRAEKYCSLYLKLSLVGERPEGLMVEFSGNVMNEVLERRLFTINWPAGLKDEWRAKSLI